VVARAEEAGRSTRAARRRLSAAFWRRPWLRGVSLLGPPAGIFLAVYIAAIAVLFISAFWALDPFTGEIVHRWGLGNFGIGRRWSY
jgi:putative spermidine/putrescine transport system permease protein